MFEVDPVFVEAVEHLDAWCRVFHALGLEEGGPGFSGDWLNCNGMAEKLGEGCCDLVGGDALGAFEFHDLVACPLCRLLLEELGGYSSDVGCGDHGHRFVEGL